jgi:hypothetical protein
VSGILCRSFKLTFNRLGKEVTINISNVHIKGEGHAAFVAYAFNIDGKSLTPQGRACMGNTVLSLDIGSSTTDIVIIDNFSYTSESVYTINKAGQTVANRLKTEIRTQNGHNIDDRAISTAITEGRYKIGGKHYPVSELLDKAKAETAALIVGETIDFISGRNVTINGISRVIVSGGGSLEAFCKAENGDTPKIMSKPLSQFIFEKLQEYNEYIEVDRYGDAAQKPQSPEKTEKPDGANPLNFSSPRFANLTGLYIMAGQKR